MATTFDAVLKIGAKVTGAGEVRMLSVAMQQLGVAAGGARTALAGLTGLGAALGAGLGVAGLAMAAKGIVDMGDSLDELAQRTGSSVDTLSQLGMAAQMTGSSVEEVSKGTVKLAKNMAEIATGGGEAAKAALDALGVSAFDVAGNLRIPSDVMLDIADGLQRVQDPALRVKLAMDLLGKGGASLAPALSQGSEAIQKLNTGISGDFAKNAGAYNDQLDILRAATVRLGASVLDALLPALIRGTTFIGAMIETASGWATNNKGAIVGMVSGVTNAIKTLTPIAVGFATFAAVQWAGSLAKLAAGFNLVRTAAQLAALAQAAYMSLTPVGAGIMLAGILAGAYAYRQLKDQMDALDKKAKETGVSTQGIGDAFERAALNADEILSSLDGQTAATGSARDAANQLAAAKERQAAIEKEMLEAQRAAVAYVDVQFQQVERINSAATARAENMRDVAQQTLSVEQAQIDVARAILDGKMSMATTDEERLFITRQIAELDRQAAQANYAAAMAQIEAEQQLEKIRVINAENNFRRAWAAYAIAVQLGTLTNDIINRLETARADLRVSAVQNVSTERGLAARRTVAGFQLQAANIRADTAANQNTGSLPIAPGNNVLIINGQTMSGIPAFAKGAHVRGPTLALIGEGGEGESVVPDSKRLGFAMNVLRGMSGAAAIPAFANGGYVVGSEGMYRSGLVSERQFINNIGRSSGPKTGLMKEYERRVAQAAQDTTDPLILSVRKNFIATDLGLTPPGSTTPMLGLYAPSGYDRIGSSSPTSVMAAPTEVRVNVPIKAQEVAPDMFLVNGSEVRRMALEVAQQAIAANNAKQRQPSAKRLMGVR